jgi:hypothetical protein
MNIALTQSEGPKLTTTITLSGPRDTGSPFTVACSDGWKITRTWVTQPGAAETASHRSLPNRICREPTLAPLEAWITLRQDDLALLPGEPAQMVAMSLYTAENRGEEVYVAPAAGWLVYGPADGQMAVQVTHFAAAVKGVVDAWGRVRVF